MLRDVGLQLMVLRQHKSPIKLYKDLHKHSPAHSYLPVFRMLFHATPIRPSNGLTTRIHAPASLIPAQY
jgi:hypothetical protein